MNAVKRIVFALGALCAVGLFAAVCAAAVLPSSPAVRALVCVTPLAYIAFSSLAGTAAGVRMPLLNWTDETAPIKQSGAVVISLFGGWGLSAALTLLYLLIGYKLGPALYLLIWALPLTLGSVLLLRWLDTRGAKQFAAL